MDFSELEKLARLIRYAILTSTTAAGSGHATSSLSAVELMTVLFFRFLRSNLDTPQDPSNDRVIFSKGHASPLLYALYRALGRVSKEEMLAIRTFGSPLEGHPTPRFVYAEAATGSLGQGLSIGVGEALALRYNQEPRTKNQEQRVLSPQSPVQSTPRVYVLLGDGELAEGSIWEAINWAGFHKLYNLIAIIDVNKLGQSQETMYGHDVATYQRRLEAFGWKSFTVDGHDMAQIDAIYTQALRITDSPTAIIATTVKGKGVSFLEGKQGWHGRALSKEELEKALLEIGEVDNTIRGAVQKPLEKGDTPDRDSRSGLGAPQSALPPAPSYDPASPVATRRAFGNALARFGTAYPQLIVLDGDVKNSTYTEFFEKAFPERFFQMYIAEQNMVGVAVGLAKQGLIPCVATFACFLTRAFDQIRMAALSRVNITFCGSHAGVSIGEDGPSQMGLEDIALFRAIHGSTVLYPADAYATEALVGEALRKDGIVYIRTTRSVTPIIYGPNEQFPVGGSKVFHARLRESIGQNVSGGKLREVATVVAAGITVHEARTAQKQLAASSVGIRVIDCYSIKPIDVETLKKAAEETRAIIVVEDHYPEGGLGEAVKSAFTASRAEGLADNPNVPIAHLAVYKTPRSGTPEELMEYEGISAKEIVGTVRSLVKGG